MIHCCKAFEVPSHAGILEWIILLLVICCKSMSVCIYIDTHSHFCGGCTHIHKLHTIKHQDLWMCIISKTTTIAEPLRGWSRNPAWVVTSKHYEEAINIILLMSYFFSYQLCVSRRCHLLWVAAWWWWCIKTKFRMGKKRKTLNVKEGEGWWCPFSKGLC